VKACEVCVDWETSTHIRPNCADHGRVECFAQTTALCQRVNGECAWVMDKALNACLAAAPVFVPPTAGGN